jgi:alpha-galactosidase
MGFNTYNAFGPDYDAKTIKEVADAMVSNGLKAAGYNYLNIDGGWWDYSNPRDQNGDLRVNTQMHPDWMKPISDYIHSKGLKFGIYLQPTEELFTSQGHTVQDANTIASWGADFLKYDGWMTPFGPAYVQMRDALAATGRHIFYSIHSSDHTPHPGVANMWRTGGYMQEMDG